MSLKHLVNHVAFVVDRSGSMCGLEAKVVQVFDEQVAHLAKRSKELDQETRVSVYLFNDRPECLVYDIDCLRLPSLKRHYQCSGGTALIDTTLKAIDDLHKTPELYGDHAFLIYVMTDGQENRSYYKAITLSERLSKLPDHWTLGCLVPGRKDVDEAVRFGFPQQNVSIWETSEKGLGEASRVITQATDAYMTARATGTRGTRNLFKVDLTAGTSTVRKALVPLDAKEYDLLNVRATKDPAKLVIKAFVESWKLPFKPGSNYYELMKPETVQAYKQVVVQDKLRGTLYAGRQARELLKLPDHEVKVQPGDFGDWRIFVQSTSTNRKLVAGTQLVVMR